MNIIMSHEDNCVICLEQIENHGFKVPCCNQQFHQTCLQKWIKSNAYNCKDCPHCREKLEYITKTKSKNICNAPNMCFNLNFDCIKNKQTYQITNIGMTPTTISMINVITVGDKTSIPIYLYHCVVEGMNYRVSSILIIMLLTNTISKTDHKIFYKQVSNGNYFDIDIPKNHHIFINYFH